MRPCTRSKINFRHSSFLIRISVHRNLAHYVQAPAHQQINDASILLVNGLAVFGGAAALALAGVLARAAVVAALAAALAFAIILSLAGVILRLGIGVRRAGLADGVAAAQD